jgi:diaminohydroxyphosphoribosylaminopyrimidine deaminase/5-amino-6-(5-phosphoribosylamino)uracil reductase
VTADEQFMYRCIQLAEAGMGHVAPNPMVGAVLVHGGRIIGEGYHHVFGEAHAEVHAIENAIASGDQELFPNSVLYVSLEPCAHFGKTPPCTDLIIRHKIGKVVVGCRDPFSEVDGKGIGRLQEAGVEVVAGILSEECIALNKRFMTFHLKKRPYIILKWAQSTDGIIGVRHGVPTDRLLITNEYSNRLVHKWRTEEASILVGTNTASEDDPELTPRLWQGRTPLRLVLDLELRLPQTLRIFNRQVKTIVFNYKKEEESENLVYCRISRKENLVNQLIEALFSMNIQSVLVEGGARLLQTFIDAGIWDEARVLTNKTLIVGEGVTAPVLRNCTKHWEQEFSSDHLEIYFQDYQ